MEKYLKTADVFGKRVEIRDSANGGTLVFRANRAWYAAQAINSHDELVAMNKELLEALEEGRRAIGDHFAPSDCYATGPMTGDEFRDLVQCPACSFIAMYDHAIAKAKASA